MREDDLLDDRFQNLLTDPKFKKPRKHDRKIKIDKRFQSMFKKDSFKVKYTVDKRGRPVSKSSTEDFKKFYDLSSDEEEISEASEDSSAEECGSEEESAAKEQPEKNDFPKLLDDEKNKKQISRDIRNKLMDMNVDYARGEGKLFSDSSSDESESEESEDEDLYHEWNELDKDAEITHEITNRLAICNMDWDRIRAVDLMMLLNSFLPSGSLVHSVVIYPSEYGLKRLQEEEVNGPAELVNTNKINSESDSDENEDEGKHFHMERMRKYQLNRLRYYYAIATFDTPATADYVYTNCNGVEYESSGIRLDLRFVDDDTTFDQEPKDVCNSTDNYQNYQPCFFTNTALQQAKVELTWDETDPKRAEFTQKINVAAKKGEINDSDLKDYVAFSSSDEEDEQDGENEQTFKDVVSGNDSDSDSEESEDVSDPIIKYRKLLKEIEENKKADREDEEELEISWGAGEEKKTVLKKECTEKKLNDDLTPFEKLIEKKKEKSKLRKIKMKKHDSEDDTVDSDKETKKGRKKKKKKKPISEEDEKQRQELELLLMEENENSKHHFSLKKILENESNKKKKLKKKRQTKEISNDDFQVDVKDERFSAIYSSHLFNIDPTNPKFTKTKGMEAFIMEKQKRIAQNDNVHKDSSYVPANKIQKTEHVSDLASLVQSVKSKSKMMLPNKYKKEK